MRPRVHDDEVGLSKSGRYGIGARLALAVALAMLVACAARAAPVPARRLLEVVDIADPVLSPDGRLVAYRTEQASVERNTYDTVWYVQALGDDAFPHRVADGGVPIRDSAGISLPALAQWSPDGRWLYYRALVDGKVDIWRAAADGSGAEPVTREAADIRCFWLSDGGRVLIYSMGASRAEVRQAEQDEYDQGVRIDASVPVGQPLFRSGRIEGRPSTQRFGKVWFDRQPLLAEAPERWMSLDLATGSREVAHQPAQWIAPGGRRQVDVDPAALQTAQDDVGGRHAWVARPAGNRGSGGHAGMVLSVRDDRDGGAVVTCDAALCRGQDITAIRWRPGTDEVLFTVTHSGQGLAQTILGWNVRSGLVKVVAASAGLLGAGRDPSGTCGASLNAMVCVAAEAAGPPRLERISLETGERQVLFAPNAGLAQDIAQAVDVELLHWKDAKGRAFNGQLFNARRSDGAPRPLFVTYYSCPGFVRGGVGDEWPLMSLAAQGISALCINRLPGYTADAVERHAQGAAAVQGAVALLTSRGEIDPSAVGMGGLSYGGAVTMWTATDTQLLAAGSISSPVVSPLYELIGSLKGPAFDDVLLEQWGLGSPDATPARWRRLSPVYKQSRITVPLLFQMSEQEYIQSLDYLIPLVREHRAELYVFPNEPHQKFQPRHKLAVYERNVDWFRFWLQGYEDPAPSKRPQYARWQVLAESVKRGK